MSAYDPGCVKTHTSAKCRKNNSSRRHHTSRRQGDFDSQMRNCFEMFLRVRRVLELSLGQDPKRTKVGSKRRSAVSSSRDWACYHLNEPNTGFRSIQVFPKDVAAPLRQVERAVDWPVAARGREPDA